MKKLVKYANGQTYIQIPPVWIEIHDSPIIEERDLSNATDVDITLLKDNPNHPIITKFPKIEQKPKK